MFNVPNDLSALPLSRKQKVVKTLSPEDREAYRLAKEAEAMKRLTPEEAAEIVNGFADFLAEED